MKNNTVARRYAKALYELAQETKTLDDILQGMQNVHMALKNSADLQKVLFNPVITSDEKQAVVKAITSNKLILKFVGLLAKRKRLDLIPLVYENLVTMSDDANGIHRVLVKTALELSGAQKSQVEKNLTQSLGGKVIGQFDVAKELIGGVWIKMGDKVLDVTLRGRIDDMRHALANSIN